MSKPKVFEKIIAFKCNQDMIEFLKMRGKRKGSYLSQVIRELIMDEMHRFKKETD